MTAKRIATTILVLMATGGCASLLPVREPYLPPPPRALSPIAKYTAPDSLAAIKAESLLVEFRKTGDGADRKGRKRGTARLPEEATYDGETANAEEELFTAREKARLQIADWSELGDAEYTMVLNQSWGLLRTVMRSGDDITIRTSIWPTDIMVTPGSARVIRVETGWVELSRISPLELRCSKSPTDPFHTPSVMSPGKPAVRMVAGIEAAESRYKSAVTAGTEVRGVTSCEASSIWRDRVAEFAFDIWMGSDRAAKLGGPPLITR